MAVLGLSYLDNLNMKNLPDIPEHIHRSMLDWIRNEKTTKEDIENISEFYHYLDFKHNTKTKYYRGLKISPKGIDKFIESGTLKLEDRGIESWSCSENIAMRFRVSGINDMIKDKTASITLHKSIPKNRVLFNLQTIRDEYEGTPFGKYARVIHDIKRYGECELVTKTVCTKCDINEMSDIHFIYQDNRQKSYRKHIESFLYRFDWKSNSEEDIYNHTYVLNNKIPRVHWPRDYPFRNGTAIRLLNNDGKWTFRISQYGRG